MGKMAQRGSAEALVKSRARRVPPASTLRGRPGGGSAAAPRGSSAGLEISRSRDFCIYLFVALKTEQWKGVGGRGSYRFPKHLCCAHCELLV